MAPVGGDRFYHILNTKYTCPAGYRFADGSFPFYYVNCSANKQWNPVYVPPCESESFCFLWDLKKFQFVVCSFAERECPEDPPLGYMNMEVDWWRASRTLGTRVNYTCPIFSATWDESLRCKFDVPSYSKNEF